MRFKLGSEFDYTGRSTWMIRDSTKLLCNILEAYEKYSSEKKGIKYPNDKSKPLKSPKSKVKVVESRIYIYNYIKAIDIIITFFPIILLFSISNSHNITMITFY
jgi:hypothetical protein